MALAGGLSSSETLVRRSRYRRARHDGRTTLEILRRWYVRPCGVTDAYTNILVILYNTPSCDTLRLRLLNSLKAFELDFKSNDKRSSMV